MNTTKTRLAAVAALLVLTGCSGTPEPAGAPTVVPDVSPTTTAAPASPTSNTPTTDPTVSTSPTPGTTTGSASTGATEAAMTEACQRVVADQQAALGAVAEYVRHPLTGEVDIADLEAARNELQDNLGSVPAGVQEQLRTQINILSDLIEGIRTRSIQNVDVGRFRDAAQQVASRCRASQ